MSEMPKISPGKAQELIKQGAVLVDIREADERARSHIAGSIHAPLSGGSAAHLPANAQAVVFHCKSGNRTTVNAAALRSVTRCDSYILDGGIDGWAAAGLPVVRDRSQPIEIMRQVQITAGSLVLLGLALGTWVAPAWYGLSAFIGAGLMFAGVTGWCGMAKALAAMPWNRRGA
jgi:rhodanese-related sulfurtransferase